MKIAVLCLSALTLAGCSHSPIKLLTPEHKVVQVPPDFYNCPVESNFPNPNKMTNKQVGSLLLKLQSNNITCKNNMDAIRQYLETSQNITTKSR